MTKIRLASFLFGAAFCATTLASNSPTTITFEEPRRFFVSCLAEYMSGTIYVTARRQVVATPSGNFHMLDNWFYTLVVTGESTGRSWISRRAVSPGSYSSSDHGDTFWFTDMAHMIPVDEGPTWVFNTSLRVRFDENGNVISESEKFATDEFIRCLGPNA
jgi:hypothetical protein